MDQETQRDIQPETRANADGAREDLYIRREHLTVLVESAQKSQQILEIAQAQAMAVRQFVNDILAREYGLQEGDQVDINGKIIRAKQEMTPAERMRYRLMGKSEYNPLPSDE